MATQPKVADAPNRCDIVNGTTDEKPAPTELCRFMPPVTVAEEFAQTAQYAKDPQAYLKSKLGPDLIEKRKELLCIPEKIDRDVYGGGEHKTHFQQHIAKLLGKQHGLFFITGIQAQLAALKIHCDRAKNNRVAWHVTSHLESAESRSFELLYGLERQLLGSTSEENPTVAEIKEVLDEPPDQRPAAILLEIPNRTLGCKTYEFSELEEISAACQKAGVKFHLDGARLWEIEPYYQKTAGKTFSDIARLFDSVYVSFYKGLRGVAGAVLVHDDEAFIREAKLWQRRAGGNVVTLIYEVVDCERGYNQNIGSFARKWAKMSETVEGITSAVKAFKNKDGTAIVTFLPEKATCCQIRTVFNGYTIEELMAARDRVQEKTNVRVLDRAWPMKTLDEELEGDDKSKPDPDGDEKDPEPHRRHVIEWMITEHNERIKTQTFIDGYVHLCEELVSTN